MALNWGISDEIEAPGLEKACITAVTLAFNISDVSQPPTVVITHDKDQNKTSVPFPTSFEYSSYQSTRPLR